MKITSPELKTTRADWIEASKEFPVINCGPTALSAIAGIKVLPALRAIPDYREKGYTSPTMMKVALSELKMVITSDTRSLKRSPETDHVLTKFGLCRIQWGGPWYGRFAYHHTHWVAAARFPYSMGAKWDVTWVFDVNNERGWAQQDFWERSTIPAILEEVEKRRGDGTWWVTHRWELDF